MKYIIYTIIAFLFYIHLTGCGMEEQSYKESVLLEEIKDWDSANNLHLTYAEQNDLKNRIIKLETK